MNAADFRRICLAQPEAEEKSHFEQPDFRVGGKIFATMNPGETRGVVMLTPEQQEMLCSAEPRVFQPVPGGWGKGGSTQVFFEHADEATLASAARMAWVKRAPKKLLKSLGITG
ncbi:MAG: MmcQ/YjbR family DNA-binding protein [Caulobacteraceae bacterium]